MAARFCDMACKCTECTHFKRDPERGSKSCQAKPDAYGNVYAEKNPLTNSTKGRNN